MGSKNIFWFGFVYIYANIKMFSKWIWAIVWNPETVGSVQQNSGLLQYIAKTLSDYFDIYIVINMQFESFE